MLSHQLTHYQLILQKSQKGDYQCFSLFIVFSLFFFFFMINDNNLPGESWSSSPKPGLNPDLPSQHRCPKSDVSAEVCSPPKMFPAIITFCDISSFCRKVFFYVKLFLIFSSDSMLFPKIYDLNPSQQFCYLSLAALNDKTHETQAFPPTLLLLGIKWFGVLMVYIFTFTRAIYKSTS